ncbi:MAG: class I SAM-dependent methyltransferase [Gemmatimonadota bacterium]
MVAPCAPRFDLQVVMPAYSRGFYRELQAATASARRVMPWLLELVQPRSIIDVGCGAGAWLQAARAQDLDDVMGIDSAELPSELLLIPHSLVVRHDLLQPIETARGFDLALCLEVAEHLPGARADSLVRDLAALAPVIVFSAAVPYQGGTHHVNEQWPAYWYERFTRAGYQALDALRPRFWRDPQVDWWYAQNAILYARAPQAAELASRSGVPVLTEPPLALVHPRAWLSARQRSTRMLLGELRRRWFGF